MIKVSKPDPFLEEQWDKVEGEIIECIERAEKVDPIKMKEMLSDLTTYSLYLARQIETHENIPLELRDYKEDINYYFLQELLR